MEEVKHFGRNRVAREYRYTPVRYAGDLLKFLHREAKTIITAQFQQLPRASWKFNVEVSVLLEKIEMVSAPTDKDNLNIIDIEPWFRSTTMTIYTRAELDEALEESLNEILRTYENFVRFGSGFYFRSVKDLRLTLARFVPLSGGASTNRYLALPAVIRRKRAVFRLTNINEIEQDRCFLHCMRVAHSTRYGIKTASNVFNMNEACDESRFQTDGLTYPTSISQIKAFEQKNNISINVFGFNKLDIYYGIKRTTLQSPVYVIYRSKKNGREYLKADLLLFKKHYFLITDLSRLVGYATPNRAHVCRSCLTVHSSKATLAKHQKFCDNRGQVYRLPHKKEANIEFTKLESLIPRAFAIYYDLETALADEKPVLRKRRKKASYRKLIYKHVPIALGAKRICYSNPEFNSELFIHVGYDCVERFLDWLDAQAVEIQHIYDTVNYPPQKTRETWDDFLAQTHCFMCKKRFTRKTQKFFDHDHLSPLGLYRGGLCLGCNLSRAKNSLLDTQITAHNGARFDTKFLIRPMAARIREIPGRFRVMNKSKEDNFVLFYRAFIFIDSFQWLPSSLAELISVKVSGQSAEKRAFPLLFAFADGYEKNYELLCQKQYFPYELVKSLKALQSRGMPPKDDFYDSLHDKEIAMEEYEHARTIFECFNCQNLQDFLVLYLTVDVLSLADIFEDYRRIAMDSFGVDPIYYLSGAHYSFHCMLKYTGVRIELLQDMEMHNFFSRSIRGGLTYIATRYMEANLPHLENYDATKPTFECRYLDCTGLYSYCLSRPLPLRNFSWMSKKKVAKFDVESHSSATFQRYGYVLEVDVSFPRELHDYFKDFPPLPEHWIPDIDMWTVYQRDLARKTGQNCKRLTKKLINHLGPRKHYVVHIELLKVCLKIGVQLDKIHRILKFEQSAWTKPYIDELAAKRREAKSMFESNYYKKCANTVYGYYIQDCTKRLKTNFVTNSRSFLRHSRKPNFKSCTIFSRHLALMEMKPHAVSLTTPIAAGFTVLELSKAHMTKFWYNFLKRIYGEDIILGFSDTDSFLFGIKNRGPSNVDETMWAHRQYFDMSAFPAPYQSPTNKKTVGTFKCELSGRHDISAFCGLRAKSYCFRLENNTLERKSKGIPRHVLSKVDFEDYRRALFQPIALEENHYFFRAIRSVKQVMYTAQERRKGLSAFDDKRVLDSDGIHTLPYYHYAITPADSTV